MFTPPYLHGGWGGGGVCQSQLFKTKTTTIQIGGGKHMIPSILEQILMLWHNIRHSAKEIKHFDEIWPSYLTFEIL